MNIHEIGETWRKLEDMLESGEISQQTYEDTVEAALKDAEPAKIESYCDYINDLKGAIAARDKRKGELEKANKTAASRIEWLEGRLRWLLEYTGRSVIKGLTYEVALRKAGGTPRVIVDEVYIRAYPEATKAFIVSSTKTEVSLSAVADALKSGQKLDWARFDEPKMRVVIK